MTPAVLRQAGAIPFRRLEGTLSFCLVTTSRGNKWGFPKGIIEPGDSPETTALKESREEAGLRGTIVGQSVGSFTQFKWGRDIVVAVYLMEVDQVDDEWDEQDVRRRRWCEAAEARALLRGRPVEGVFLGAVKALETAR